MHALFSSFFFNGFNYFVDKIVAKRKFLVARLQNQIGPCSKVFKIISRNLIQKRTEDIYIQKEKQNNLTTRFKTNTIYKSFVATIEGINETQSISIHDVLKGLQSIIRRFQTRSNLLQQRKRMD